MTDANNLYDGYLRSIATSRWKETTQRVETDFLRVIFQLQDELENQTYKPSKENEFVLHERGKIRPITSLHTRDRIVRHVLCDHILTPRIAPYIIYDNGASTKGRGLSFAQKRLDVHLHKYFIQYHTNKGYLGLTDFSKFYDNIPHDKAKSELLYLCGNDSYMDWLLSAIFKNFRVDASLFTKRDFLYFEDHPFDKVWYRENRKSNAGRVFLEKSANIGDQLAQNLGIYYPYRIDNYVKIVRGQKYYARYMDDSYIINPNRYEIESIIKGIDILATGLGLFLNQKKTRIVHLDESFIFLQTRYELTKTGKIIKHINPKTIVRLRRKLKKFAKNDKMPYDRVEQMFKSEMGNYYKLMSRKEREDLIELYQDLFHVKVNIVKGKMVICSK